MKFKLPAKFRKDWLAALRSGKYKQGTAVLYNPELESYCCLGIGCLLVGFSKEELIRKSYPINIEDKNNKIPYLLKDTYSILSNRNTFYNTLSQINDIDKKSFSEIVDWIEENTEDELTHKIISSLDIDFESEGIFQGTFKECEKYIQDKNMEGYEIVPNKIEFDYNQHKNHDLG